MAKHKAVQNEINILLRKSNGLISIDELVKKTNLPESIILNILETLNAICVDDFVLSDFYTLHAIKKLNDFIHANDISGNISISEISEKINVPANMLFAIVHSVFVEKNPRYKHILLHFPILASKIRDAFYATEYVSKVFISPRKFAFHVRHRPLSFKENLLLPLVGSLAISIIVTALIFFFSVSEIPISLFLGFSSFIITFALMRSEELSCYSADILTALIDIGTLTATILIPCYVINVSFGIFWAILIGSILYIGLLYSVVLSDSDDP
ncbi:MAG: hypothetical protein ACP6IU_05160 [Candidatus Asgardarchaeia archaeon]